MSRMEWSVSDCEELAGARIVGARNVLRGIAVGELAREEVAVP